jgi:hypothetical protein
VIDDALAGPIHKLLALGEPKYSREFDWPDYLSLGIVSAHIPQLIEVATDHALIHLSDDNDPRGWAPVHAWRALGQLQACEAIAPLMCLFHEVRDNDWVIEELPDVMGMIGPAAFPALAEYLINISYPAYSRLVAATSIMQICLLHPELRAQGIEALAGQLINFEKNSPGMNGVLIAELVELGAADKSELIHKAFAAARVDRFIVGDWRDIKKRLARPDDPSVLPPQASLHKKAAAIPPDPRPAYKEPRTTPRRL